jgi:hypothetical protein
MIQTKEEMFLAELGINPKEVIEGLYGSETKITELLKKHADQQLILSGVSNRLNEGTLEEINTIMWESHMIKSKTFDKTQGTMIMQELEKWAGR